MKTTWIAGAVLALGLAGTNVALADGNAQAGQTKAAVCAGCHGPDGNSPLDQWPKLAGQLPAYIGKQLHDFKAGRRKNDQMSPMAQPLSDQDIQDLAAYFSSQKASRVAVARNERLALGERIYLKGKGRPEVVPACVGCHGPGGVGKADWPVTMIREPVVLAPAIGSQHAAYTGAQLKAYKTGGRSNDLSHVMRDVAGRLSEGEIAAVADYVASLGR
ncbi:MAG: c-type cytochrome [Burkholderiaceae bacterium]